MRQLLMCHESCARAKVNCEVGALRLHAPAAFFFAAFPFGGRATHSAASSAVAKLPRCTCLPPLVTCVTYRAWTGRAGTSYPLTKA